MVHNGWAMPQKGTCYISSPWRASICEPKGPIFALGLEKEEPRVPRRGSRIWGPKWISIRPFDLSCSHRPGGGRRPMEQRAQNRDIGVSIVVENLEQSRETVKLVPFFDPTRWGHRMSRSCAKLREPTHKMERKSKPNTRCCPDIESEKALSHAVK